MLEKKETEAVEELVKWIFRKVADLNYGTAWHRIGDSDGMDGQEAEEIKNFLEDEDGKR